MHLRTHARRAAVLLTSVASAALLAGVIPASPASAETNEDHLVLLDTTRVADASGRLTALKAPAMWSPSGGLKRLVTSTSPARVVGGIDAARDGNTWVAGLKTGNAATSDADATFALALVHRTSTGTITRVISSTFDSGNPVISPDGLKVWWFSNGDLFRYDVKQTSGVPDWTVQGAVTKVPASSAFKPVFTSDTNYEVVAALAVSPDLTDAAVVYQTVDANLVPGKLTVTGSRVLAADMASGKSLTSPWFETTDSSTTNPFSPDPLAWADSDTVLLGKYQSGVTTNFSADLVVGGASTYSSTPDINGRYALRNTGSGWWSWRDSGDPITSSFAKVSSPLDAVLPENETAFPLGSTTSTYIPVGTEAPVMNWAKNRATATAQLYMSNSSVLYNKRAAYLSFASYLTKNAAETSAQPFATFRGELQWTNNPFVANPTWNPVPTTGSNGLITWGSAYPKAIFNGTTHYLKRNTWFRWLKKGDAFVKADMTDGTIKITVRPIISVSKTALTSSGTRKVYGSVTRVGGTAVLQRYSNGSWSTITQTSITSTGKYSFGYRALRSGTYRVLSLATQSWGSNTKSFSI